MQHRLKYKHTYMVCKPTSTYLITQNKQVGSTTYTNTCKGTKPTHAKRRVTFNVDKLSTYYRKEEHWIYDINKIIQLNWLETIYWWRSLNSSWYSQVSNALQQIPIDQVLVWWSPTKLGPKRLVTIGLATQMVLFLTPHWVPTYLANTLPTLSLQSE
jgi:hypothetical protein